MRANRRVDTGPERRVRSLLYARGLRFRKDFAIKAGARPVRADIAFPRARVAIFIDGCFWHQCPDHGLMPQRNREYWEPKLRANVDRDARVNAELRRAAWTVLRFWEHESPDRIAREIARQV